MEPTQPNNQPALQIQLKMAEGMDPVQGITQVTEKLMKEFTTYEDARKPYEMVWMECYRMYVNAVENLTTPTRAKIFIPAVFQVIEAAVPKILSVIFGGPTFFEVVPDNKKLQNQADVIQILLEYQLAQSDFFLKFIDFTKQLLLYGTSYFKIYWKVRRAWVWKRTPVRGVRTILGFKISDNAILNWKEEKSYEVVERRPEIDVLDVLDVFPDPEATTEKDAKAIWVRSWMDIETVREMGQGQFPVFDPVQSQRTDLTGAKSMGETRVYRKTARGISATTGSSKDQVEILERWGLYDLDGDGVREECLFVIANRTVLLRAIPNPFHHQKKPIIRSVLFPVPLEWYGIGLVEPVIPLQHELNTLRRQRLDNINMAINRMWKVNSYADIDLEALVSSPNGIILTDDMEAIDTLPTTDVTTGAYNEAAIVQNDIENATAPKSVQGSPDNGRLGRTAKGAELIIGQALEKFGVVVKLIEESAVKRTLRMYHQLNLQFIDDDDVMQQTGQGMYGHLFSQKVTPEMIRSEVIFKMKGISEIIGSEGKINQIVAFMGVFGPTLAPESIEALMKKMWGLMGFDKDEVNLVAVAPMPTGADLRGDTSKNATDSAVAQVNQNGSTAPMAMGVTPGKAI
jgi:hypothetical protein